eukprot:TRINITY_DN115718_c0_g1_i1.p1 TRINITY_DN115718_c0_g1~~TRINITY_DN115718_c0_g1_i1.p1  ORF type:complete len:236 (-),score=25.25 TRINITY_DN115718_c0_g1_i1:71-778(-)
MQVLQAMSEVTGQAGKVMGKALDLPYTADLNDKELLQILAACAANAYTLSLRGPPANWLEMIDHQTQKLGEDENGIQFGLYKIKKGKHAGKTVLAFRGSENILNYLQTASATLGGPIIRLTIKAALERTQERKPSFVTGHSLGGFLAECVCSHTGIPGAAFCAPGPWASNPKTNCTGNKYNKVPFEIHQSAKDCFSMICCAGGPNSSHIGTPKWHELGGVHAMKDMRDKAIGRLN